MYDELAEKVNAINTKGLVKKADYNAKITDIEEEMSSITNLATTTTALSAVENEIPNVSTLVEKADYNDKI